MESYVGVFIDGGFYKRKFRSYHYNIFPLPSDVQKLVESVMADSSLSGDTLFRSYFYDCWPFEGKVLDERSGQTIDFANTGPAKAQAGFLHEVAKLPQMALRAGELSYQGLFVPPEKFNLDDNGRLVVQGHDLVHNFQQKQVDIKLGLDIAQIAQKGIVRKLVLVAGDSDLVPAMKFARKEGMLVYLATLGHNVRPEMVAHSDFLLQIKI